ncbi:unnamed protein product [Mytilus coruscus]|uniref:WSC domain-containing protein n=1 Tax=Mytilus coruscus TaxID=42192 RepID=A0A6J8EUK7_MYTCO|nr:unnamed protein product [Mytilus coruscus]
MNTWQKAVLDCYGYNSVLESNVTVLKKYLSNHAELNRIWVGSFEVFLPWIEIRGCYNIPFTCNSLDRHEKVANNQALCQLKCMKNRYFAFNQKIDRCVCFDKHEQVMRGNENASLCQECKVQGDCNGYAVAYKVLDISISEAGNDHDCLFYQCDYQGAMPVFDAKSCSQYCESYCRDGRRVNPSNHQTFVEYRSTCEGDYFTYPLLHSDNPVKLCNVSKFHTSGIDIWVGVYRLKLDIDSLEKTVLQDFYQIAKYISKCSYLSTDGALVENENCSNELTMHHYICTSDKPMNVQKDPNNSSTSTSACGSEGKTDNSQGITNKDKQSSGVIAGTVASILVIVVVVVIVVFICKKRFNSKIPKLKDKHSEKDPSKSTTSEQEKISDGQYHEIDITLGPYSFAKPLADTYSRVNKAAEDENAYSRIVSAVFDTSNIPEKTNHVISNPGYNDLQIKVDTKNNPIGSQQSSNSLKDKVKPPDYCIAKPITDPGEMDPYTDNADYDHLCNVKNREENTVKIYDHVPNIIDSDATYDHSTINICTAESNNYDHFDVQN